MKRLLLILSLVVVAGATSGAGVRSATTAVQRAASNADGAIVFASSRDGNSDLYAVKADGTGLTQLTNEPSDAYNPLPSPDGRHILFEGGEGMTVMDVDGSGRRAIRSCSVSPEAWSSDSRHLVCSDYEAGILVVDTVDGTFTQLSDTGSRPSWSPDGMTIAFVDENKLYVIPAAGGTRHRLGIRKLADSAAPAWSGDSQRLAYVSVESGYRYSLWTIRADGSGGRRLAQNVSEETPSWSPDGARIAFLRYLPHDVAAVSTVRSDGSGLQNVASGLVYLSDPSWSADGQVLYELGRFQGSEETDVYVVSPTGRGSRALTHPFPTGGTNTDARWITGLHPSGTEQLPPTMSVPFKRKMRFAQAVVWMATDGSRAVPRLDVDKHPRLTIWDGATGRARRGPAPCGDLYGPGDLALAGDRLAWTCAEAGNTYYAVQLMTGRVGDRRGKSIASASGDPNEGGDDIVGVLGHGSTIVFSEQHRNEHGPSDPWLVLTHKAKKCPGSDFYNGRARCRPLGGGRGITNAVDGKRVLTVTPTGVVRTLSLSGSVLHTWSLGKGVVTTRLRGRVLAVQQGTTVDAYDAKTGAKRQSRELRTDGGPPPILLGVQGDLVVYKTGGAIHLLRLSDGRDKALLIPGAAPWFDASLEPGGLFVSWNKMHDRRPGRMAFISLRTIAGRL
jgi:Tol biopolymer transport system component